MITAKEAKQITLNSDTMISNFLLQVSNDIRFCATIGRTSMWVKLEDMNGGEVVRRLQVAGFTVSGPKNDKILVSWDN